MSSNDSSSFYKKAPESQPQLRTFDVGAPSQSSVNQSAEYQSLQNASPAETVLQKGPGYELSDAERQDLMRSRAEANQNRNKVGDYAKKRIEILANIGRLYKDVTIEGIVFGLRTLKTREAREAAVSITTCDSQIDAAFEVRRQSLARAIYQIDGQSVEDALGGIDFALKLDFVDGMEDSVFTKLWNEFDNLRQESSNKYGVNSEETVKEVVEDLKK